MTDVVYQFRVNQTVNTPHGRAIIQGRMVDDEGRTRILVSHDPIRQSLPDEIMRVYKGGIWVLWSYPVEDISPVEDSRPVRRRRRG